MRQRTTAPRRAIAARFTGRRFAVGLVGVVGLALMLLTKVDTVMTERLRLMVIDALSPVMAVFSEPATVVARARDAVVGLSALYTDNARLREENRRLRRWWAAAQQLEIENAALKDLLNLAPSQGLKWASGRVIADAGGAFARSVIVLAGTRDHVSKGDAALSGEGLIGRVSEAGRRASRVLLITDINSRIPVIIAGSRQRAILAGDNTNRPQLLFLHSRPSLGDRVVTSGAAGALPPGLPVGLVASVGDVQSVRVEPYFKRDQLEYLRLARYETWTVSEDADSNSADGGTTAHSHGE